MPDSSAAGIEPRAPIVLLLMPISSRRRPAIHLLCSACLSVSFIVGLGLSAGPPPAPKPPSSPLGPFQHGMTLGVYSRGSENDLRPQVRDLMELGFDSVSLVAPVVLHDVHSMEFTTEPTATPTDEALRRAARLSHAAGMRVMLFPIVYIWELDEGDWRGTIEPADWSLWFERYGEVILRYARLAQDEGIEYFSVGSELCSSEGLEGEWRRLIGRVRGEYGGALTYSANWDHREVARFFDAVDFVGMNAYFRLAGDDSPTEQDLVDAWVPVVRDVEDWASRWGRPLVITEIGYPSRRGAAFDPWDYTVQEEPDPEGQATLYRAFLKAWARVPGLSGVYFYMWWGQGGPQDIGYSPKGKPAEQVLRDWLEGGAWQGQKREPI
ncbi:MAG: hypothetical protein O7F16_09370 [Acidobacteria bacterium]|nr:hypothetical protein [Acidobacteriota bacterium]